MARLPQAFVPTFVDTRPELEALADRLRGQPALGIDTEFISERTHAPRLELLVYSYRNKLANPPA